MGWIALFWATKKIYGGNAVSTKFIVNGTSLYIYTEREREKDKEREREQQM